MKDAARFVADNIRNIIACDPGARYRGFTVIYRTNTRSRPFEEMFFEEGIPCTIIEVIGLMPGK